MRQSVNIVCVKYGTKYGADRVKRLYDMVKKNCTLPFTFFCLTDDKELSYIYKPIPLDPDLDLESYWWKIQLFSLPWNSPTLYFDLDVVIQNNIDHLIKKIKRRRILLIDSTLAGIDQRYDIIINEKATDPFCNSSVIGIYPKSVYHVYKNFIRDIDYNVVTYFGLDRFISHNYKPICNSLCVKNDFYFRWKDPPPPRHMCHKVEINGYPVFLAYEPKKTLCIITQEHQNMYLGLEEYFI